MARTRSISDEQILSAARELFRAQGHDVSTRQVAERAGISEGVLYQRFANKNELFFAAMAPGTPDLENVLGPDAPTDEPRKYLKGVLVKMADYFAEMLPLALRLITHPSFDRNSLGNAQTAATKLQEALRERLSRFERQRQIRKSAVAPMAQLLVRLAHDWGLARATSGRNSPRRTADLEAIVDMVWQGAAVRGGPRH